jgi:hypothetical protein
MVEHKTPLHELSWHLGANRSPLSKFHQNLEFPRRYSIKFYPIQMLEASLNFNSKSTLNVKKFLYGKLLVSSNPSKRYYISDFLSSGRYCLDWNKFARLNLNLNSFGWFESLLTAASHCSCGAHWSAPISSPIMHWPRGATTTARLHLSAPGHYRCIVELVLFCITSIVFELWTLHYLCILM